MPSAFRREESDGEARVTPPSQDRVVLVVDDDVAIREMLARALDLEGFVAIEAGNGQEALARLRSKPRPGVILLDLRMPVMDGWAFRRAQLADRRLAPIPVVILSGADAHRFSEIEAVAAFEKPVAIADLIDRLRQFFEG